jgi:ABC-type sugar transport system substrate-binding protein
MSEKRIARRRYLRYVGGAIALGAAAAVGYGISEYRRPPPVAPPVKRYKIGYITRLSVPWWIVCEAGFKKAAKDYGFDPVVYHPPELTVEDQVRVMDSWIAAGMDAVFIGPNDPVPPVGVINKAIDKGTPVLCGYGVDSPGSKRLLFVGYDPYALGVALGKGIVKLLELAGKSPPGKITYHTGGMVSTEDVASWEGFKAAVEPAGYTAVEPVLDGGDAAKAVALAEEAIKLYEKDLVGMLGYYDYTGPALGKAVTDAGKIGKIIVHADGLIGEMVPYFESGAIGATIELRQYEGSYIAGEILYKLLEAGRELWDDVLKKYVPEYPTKKALLLGFGWVTGKKLGVEPWPELAWIKTLEEFKRDYPEVWEIIG